MPKLTITDKILAATILPFIPRSVKPNHLTVFRFATIPIIFYLFFTGNLKIGFILFLLSAFSDAVDGALARTRNMISRWGEVFDPLADKLLIGVMAVLVISRLISDLLAYLIVFFELTIIVNALIRERFFGYRIKSSLAGKIKMVFQSIGVALALIGVLSDNLVFFDLAEFSLILSLIFAFLSLFIYYSA
jgi:CDP-diacylglycerol--glycerol-3-phosphate 3-phosphatidyltransferase